MTDLMSMPTSTRQGGFTLIELLVAITVLGLLIVGLSRGVQTGITLRQKQAEHVRSTADLDAAMRVLRKVLTKIPVMPGGEQLAATAEGPVFQGEPDRVSFVGNLPTGLGQSRRAEITLFLRDKLLILAWTPHPHRRLLVQPRTTETELVRGVVRLDLAYWGAPVPDQPAEWQARWEDATAPDLIRVRLVLPEKDRRRWPDLIVDSRL
jgi:general secretion pathway protein J